jgi:Fur family ferric uptake transcriptional regulator/Fur family peroxide stress response transcriptional regulator
VLHEATDHPTAQEVFERVRRTSPGIGFATVYRTLNLLVAGGHALELSLGDASARYDANTDRHDHVVCVDCGRATDLPATLAADALARVGRTSGFTVTTYDLQFRGQCPDCART